MYLENIFIYGMNKKNQPLENIFNLQGLFLVSLKNLVCKDNDIDGLYFQIAAKFIYIQKVEMKQINQILPIFKISSQQAFISDINISCKDKFDMSSVIEFQQADYQSEQIDDIKGFTHENCMDYTSCYTNRQNGFCFQELYPIYNVNSQLGHLNLQKEILQDNIIFFKEQGIAQVIISKISIEKAIITRSVISIICTYQPAFISISQINFKQSEYLLDTDLINFEQQNQYLFFISSDQSLVSLADINFFRFNTVTNKYGGSEESLGNSSNFKYKIQSLIFIDSEIIYVKNIIADYSQDAQSSLISDIFQLLESKFIQFIARTFILKDSIFKDFSCSKGGLLISPIQLNIDLYMKNVTLSNVVSEGDGGVLYFYIIESSVIYIDLKSCNFERISKNQGGLIAIDNSNDQIKINIEDTVIKNIFCNQNTLISITQQGDTFITLSNIKIFEDENRLKKDIVQNSMLNINSGVIVFNSVTLENLNNYDLIFILDNSIIVFYNVTIKNVQTHSGLLRAKFTSSILFQDVTIQNVKRYNHLNPAYENNEKIDKQIFGSCNPDIYLYMGQMILFKNVTFDNNQVLPCGKSFIAIQNSNFYLDNITIKNNYSDKLCIDIYYYEYSFIQLDDEHYQNNLFGNLIINSSIQNNLLYGMSLGIIQLSNLRVFIVNSTFEKNQAQLGGAIHFQQTEQVVSNNENSQNRFLQQDPTNTSFKTSYDSFIQNNYSFIIKYNFKYEMIIDQCNFTQNQAEQGGALYLNNIRGTTISLQFAILNSTFEENNANLNSPAISCLKYVPSVINVNFKKNSLINNLDANPLNIAPSQISVSNTTHEDINFISNIISGVEIESNITFQFKDLANQKVYLNTFLTDLIPQIFLSYDNNKIALENYQQSTGELILGNVSFIYQPGQNATVSLTSKHIITPILDDNLIVTSFDNTEYVKKIIVEFRNCTAGEIFLSQKKMCQLCPSGSYSRQSNQKNQADVCLTCPEGGECPGGNIVYTKDGYWQDPTVNSEESQILYCLFSESNCLSNSNSSYSNIIDPYQRLYFPCKLGHVGALCQSCDTQNGLYQCSECSDKVNLYLKVGFIIFGGLTLALLTVYSIINETQNKIIKNALKLFGILSLGTASQYSPVSSSLFKILINHSQINLIAFSLSQAIPQELTQIINMVVSPFRLIKTGFDCVLSEHFVQKLVFIKTIFFSLQPIIFYVLIMVCFVLVEIIRKRYIKSYYFYTSCFFVVLYLIPEVIQQLILAISCQRVGQNKYMIADMTIVCFSNRHMYYIKYVIIPGLIVYGVLIPILMVTLLCVNKKHFTNSYFEIKYGFLYKEFKPNMFYWEVLRLLFKVFIYSFIGLWNSEIQTKGLISILILILYFQLFQKVQPFKNFDTNMLELTSVQINIICLTLVVFAYQISNIGFQFFVYTVIICLNFYFFYQIAKEFYKIYKKQIILIKSKIMIKLKKLNLKCLQKCYPTKNQSKYQNKKTSLNLEMQNKKSYWKIVRDYFFLYKKVKKQLKNNTLSLFSLEILKLYQISKVLQNNQISKFEVLENKKQKSISNQSSSKKLFMTKSTSRSAEQLMQHSRTDSFVKKLIKTKSLSTDFSDDAIYDTTFTKQLTRTRTKHSRKNKNISFQSTEGFLQKNISCEQQNVKTINKTQKLLKVHEQNSNIELNKTKKQNNQEKSDD